MQVHYFVVPPPGSPFAAQAELRLGRIPHAVRHPDLREKTWIVGASPDMARWVAAKLKQDPRTSLASQGLVTIHPASIEIVQDAPREILNQLEPFVTWLLKSWPCQVITEDGDDWTARYAHDPRALFYEEESWG